MNRCLKMNKKTDRRIERTRTLLRDALMGLVVEKGYDTITIQDIADRANVARTTFYLHFRDKDELLFESIREIFDTLMSSMPSKTWEDVGIEGTTTDPTDPADFEHIAQHADFYRTLLGENGSAKFLFRLRKYLADLILQQWQGLKLPEGHETRFPDAFTAYYCAGGLIGLFVWWLETGLPRTPEEMSRMSYEITLYGALHGFGLKADSVVHS